MKYKKTFLSETICYKYTICFVLNISIGTRETCVNFLKIYSKLLTLFSFVKIDTCYRNTNKY